MSRHIVTRRDTPAWIFQVWAAFGVAVCLCVIGVWHMPSVGMERALLSIGMFFCLSSALSLAKTTRDNRDGQVDTSAWIFQVWAAFVISNLLTGWGLYRMHGVEIWHRWFLVASWLFLVSAAFTLAKTIRDNHEAARDELAMGGPVV